MRKLLIASASAVVLFSAAGAAQAEGAVGHVGANYARTDLDAGGVDADQDVFQAEGSVAFDTGSLGVAFDGSVADSKDIDTVWTGTAHLNYKFGAARLGGFAGLQDSNGDTLWAVGAEGQTDLAPSTVLYGQAGYGQIDDLDVDLWAARGELRQYFGENIKLTGSLGYMNADFGPLDVDGWNVGVEGEYQFKDTPFSVFGGWSHFDSNDLDANTDTLQVGVRFTFGGATLRGRDAAGASLSGVNKLFTGIN
jgi:opacity protein-like surface antigen